MATTIKVDGTVATFSWQDDQSLDPGADVDYYKDAENLDTTMVPKSTVGKGADAPATTKGTAGTDTL